MENVKKSFLKGAAILTLAAFISKLLGAVYRVPYQNMTGDLGMYVYQQVYPLYSLFLLLATAGFPIAISKLVSERVSIGDAYGAKRIVKVATHLLLCLGIVSFLILFLSAGLVAEWMGNRVMLTLPIQAVACALLIVPALSALRGYFQGYEQMEPAGVSQVVEQLIRVMTILGAAYFFMNSGAGVVWAGTGAMFGASTGGVSGLLVLWWYLHKATKHRRSVKKSDTHKRQTTYELFKRLLHISLPICLSALALPLYSLVDSFSITNLLVADGWTFQAAMLSKGAYDRGQPLIQFASFFATAISLSIVPAIAAAFARNEQRKAKRRALLALRLTLILGLPASVGLAVVAAPTNVMLFKDTAGTDALAILSISTLFSTLATTATAILQGGGRIYQPVFYMLIGVLTKILGNLFCIPLWGIVGSALATVLAYTIMCLLNLLELKHQFRLQGWGISWLLKMLISVGVMATATFFTLKGLSLLTEPWLIDRLAMACNALGTVCVGIIVYLWIILRIQLLNRTELALLPKALHRFAKTK